MPFKTFVSVLLASLLLYGMPTFAIVAKSDCANIDYSSKMPPIRTQGHQGQCFSFTAADLMGFAQDLPPDKAISGLDVAATFLNATPKELSEESSKLKDWSTFKKVALEYVPIIERDRKKKGDAGFTYSLVEGGGFVELAVLAYQRNSHGLCLEQKMRSQGTLVDKYNDYYLGEKVRKLTEKENYAFLPREYMEDRYIDRLKPLPPSHTTLRDSFFLCPKDWTLFNNSFPWIQQMNKEAVETLFQNINTACAPRTPMKPMTITNWSVSFKNDSKKTSSKLASFLRDGTPVGIGYDPSFLQLGREADFEGLTHASSIVGMRWNKDTKSCEFKLRNSWGPKCDIYASEYRDSCEKEDSYIWISESDVADRVGELTVIKTGKK